MLLIYSYATFVLKSPIIIKLFSFYQKSNSYATFVLLIYIFNYFSQGPAELIQVSWLEVSGMVNVKIGKKYKVTFDVKVKDDGFGWNETDVLVMAKVGKTGKYQYEVTKLSPGMQASTIPTKDLVIEVKGSSDSVPLHFGLYEVWSGKWKGGLEIIKADVTLVV